MVTIDYDLNDFAPYIWVFSENEEEEKFNYGYVLGCISNVLPKQFYVDFCLEKDEKHISFKSTIF